MPRMFEPTRYQRAILSVPQGYNLLLCGGRGGGKLLYTSTPIQTPKGWKQMGDVEIGNQVLDEHRLPCRVVDIANETPEKAYRLYFSNGDAIEACDQHQWVTVTEKRLKLEGGFQWNWGNRPSILTQQIVDSLWLKHTIALPSGQHVQIVGAEPCAPAAMRCLTVDSPNSMYLAGESGIPTHNSVSLMQLMLRHVEEFKELAYVMYVRETYAAIQQLEEDFELLLLEVYGKGARHNKTEHTFYFQNGAKVQFGQLADQKDYYKYQGRNVTFLLCDEVGQITNMKWMTLLMSNIRGPKGMPLRTVWAANPGGPQHGFLHHEFIAKSEAWAPFKREDGEQWVCCPSTWRDNPTIDAEKYLLKLRAACGNDEELFKAWDTGDWNIARGAFFAGALDERLHKLSDARFPVQKLSKSWVPYIAMDWGSGAPSVTYICAESPGVDGFPKGSLILCDELATADANDLNQGLNWPPTKLAEAVKDMAKTWNCPPEGVGDEAYGLEESLLQKFAEEGLYLVRPKKERVSGWQQMKNMLTSVKKRDGQPGLWISSRCEYFWKTVPFLPRDDKRPEDLLTTGPDHAADACFVAGTLVRTATGLVPIETLSVGDMVETRVGPRPVIATGQRPAATYRVDLSDGTSLTVTGNHPFHVKGQWKCVDSLEYGDILTTWQSLTQSCSKESSIEDTQSQIDSNPEGTIHQTAPREALAEGDCIKRCGNPTMGLFPGVITYTTSMKTRSTTTSQISPVCPSSTTCQSTPALLKQEQDLEKISRKPSWLHLSGTPVLKALSGIGRMARSAGRLVLQLSSTANTVGSRRALSLGEWSSSAAMHASQRGVEQQDWTTWNESVPAANKCSSATSTAKQPVALVSVVGCSPTGNVNLVYNLEVSDQPEYFAGGVLVHNCRYGVMNLGRKLIQTKTTGYY